MPFNDAVRLPRWVVVWATTLTLAALGAWLDIRVRVTSIEVRVSNIEQNYSIANTPTRKEIEALAAKAEAEHAMMEARMGRLENRLDKDGK